MKLENKIKLVLTLLTVCILMVPTISILATRTITDTSDTVYSQIIAGSNTYSSTFANLVTLCATPGLEIKVPSCNITFTDTLYIASGVWLHGCGNSTIFYLADNINKTMIKNIGGSAINNDMRISDIRLECNAMN